MTMILYSIVWPLLAVSFESVYRWLPSIRWSFSIVNAGFGADVHLDRVRAVGDRRAMTSSVRVAVTVAWLV